MKTLTATLIALSTTLAMLAPAHAADTDKDSMGMEEKMMRDDMKDDGMHKDTMKADTMHDEMKTEDKMNDGMEKGNMAKETMEKDMMSDGTDKSM